VRGRIEPDAGLARPHHIFGFNWDRVWIPVPIETGQIDGTVSSPTLKSKSTPDGQVPADRVVEPLDVVEHVDPGGVPRTLDLFADPLGLQRGEEALHRGVVLDVAGPAHGTDDAIVGHQPVELLARILAALV
jgi:hypothetical protein